MTETPCDDDSTMNSAGLPLSCAATMNNSAFAAAGTNDFDAVEPVAARRAHRGGLQRGRIEQGVRLGDRHACLRHVLACELLQVRRLLIGAAPMGERRRDAGGRQDRQRESHVAVGQCLGHQHIGDRCAVRGDSVEVLGDVDRRDAEFGGLGDQVSADRWRPRRRRGLLGE